MGINIPIIGDMVQEEAEAAAGPRFLDAENGTNVRDQIILNFFTWFCLYAICFQLRMVIQLLVYSKLNIYSGSRVNKKKSAGTPYVIGNFFVNYILTKVYFC